MATTVKSFLKTYFEEKMLRELTFEIEHNGTKHFVENGFVIDLIVNHTIGDEQRKIRDIICQIDFKNGNVNHFLEHLATGYVKTNY